MAKGSTTPAPGTEESNEPETVTTEKKAPEKKTTEQAPKTVTPEQFEELRKAQAGSDQKVSELLAKIASMTEAAEKEKTEAQKTTEERIAALEQEREAARAEVARERLRNAGIKQLTTAGLPVEVEGWSPVDFLVGKDEAATQKNIEAFGKYLESYFVGRAQPAIRDNGRTPRTRTDDDDKYLTIEQINNMTPEEYATNEKKVEESIKHWYASAR